MAEAMRSGLRWDVFWRLTQQDPLNVENVGVKEINESRMTQSYWLIWRRLGENQEFCFRYVKCETD